MHQRSPRFGVPFSSHPRFSDSGKEKERENSRKKKHFVCKEKIDRSRTRNSEFEDLDTCDSQLISIAAWNTLAAKIFVIVLVGFYVLNFGGACGACGGRSFGSGDRERGGVGLICLSDRKGKR